MDEGEIGRGAYGFVNRMVHRPTKTAMAVKVYIYITDKFVSPFFRD